MTAFNYRMQIPGVGIRRSTLRLFALFTLYIVFLILGAAVFSAIQDPEETRIVNDLRRAREKFLQLHHCVDGKFNFKTGGRLQSSNCWRLNVHLTRAYTCRVGKRSNQLVKHPRNLMYSQICIVCIQVELLQSPSMLNLPFWASTGCMYIIIRQ